MGKLWAWLWRRFAPEVAAALAGAVMLGITAFETGRDWLGLMDADGTMQPGVRWAWVFGFALVAHVVTSIWQRTGAGLRELRQGVLRAIVEGENIRDRLHAANNGVAPPDTGTVCTMRGLFEDWERRWADWLAVEGEPYDLLGLFRSEPAQNFIVPGKNSELGRAQLTLSHRLDNLRQMRSMLLLGALPTRG